MQAFRPWNDMVHVLTGRWSSTYSQQGEPMPDLDLGRPSAMPAHKKRFFAFLLTFTRNAFKRAPSRK